MRKAAPCSHTALRTAPHGTDLHHAHLGQAWDAEDEAFVDEAQAEALESLCTPSRLQWAEHPVYRWDSAF